MLYFANLSTIFSFSGYKSSFTFHIPRSELMNISHLQCIISSFKHKFLTQIRAINRPFQTLTLVVRAPAANRIAQQSGTYFNRYPCLLKDLCIGFFLPWKIRYLYGNILTTA